MKQSSFRRQLHKLTSAATLGFALAAPFASQAQVAPSAAEVAGYRGLHAAAHHGDLAQLESLLAARVDVNARDAYGRTPLHVATFARQREAIRQLVKAGANLGLLERDRYDAVTIAAVADDDLGVVGEEIDDLALALVAPLEADDAGIAFEERGGHGWMPFKRGDSRFGGVTTGQSRGRGGGVSSRGGFDKLPAHE